MSDYERELAATVVLGEGPVAVRSVNTVTFDRGELLSMKARVSELVGRAAAGRTHGSEVLREDEERLLGRVWEMLGEILG